MFLKGLHMLKSSRHKQSRVVSNCSVYPASKSLMTIRHCSIFKQVHKLLCKIDLHLLYQVKFTRKHKGEKKSFIVNFLLMFWWGFVIYIILIIVKKFLFKSSKTKYKILILRVLENYFLIIKITCFFNKCINFNDKLSPKPKILFK